MLVGDMALSWGQLGQESKTGLGHRPGPLGRRVTRVEGKQ
jgi:hypothetical protein